MAVVFRNGMFIDTETGQPVAGGYGTQPYVPPQITNVSNPQDAARQDRIYAYGRGEELDAGYRDDLSNANRALGGYSARADEYFGPLAGGQGGVRGSELDRILQREELNALQMTPEEIEGSYLTGEEQRQILGDPNNRRKFFNPNYENQIFDETQGFRRGAVDDYGRDLRGAYDPNNLRAPSGYYGALADSRDQFASNSREALDPSGLTVSDQFLQDYKLTPEQQQDMITSAAATVGTRDKAAIGELERRARAAGTNPLGVAAFRQRTERESSANAADAALRAKVTANEVAAERMRTGEDMRLRYGQNLANMRTGVERDIADSGYRTAQAAEATRSGVERDIADRNTYAADRAGQARIGNETDLARERLGLQQSIADRGDARERDVDDAWTNRQRDIALNRQGTQQYVAGQRYNRGLGASDRLSNRYQYGADTTRDDAREGRAYYAGQVTQANQNAQRGMDRRLQLYGQQTGAGQDATRTSGQLYESQQNRPRTWERIAGAGLGTLAMFSDERMKEDIQPVGKLNNNLPVYSYRYKGQPQTQIGLMAQDVEQVNPGAVATDPGSGMKMVDYLKATEKGGGYEMGGVVTEPTYAMIGESGPEAVVPLTPPQAGTPVTAPSMSMRYGQPPSFNTAQIPMKPKAAYSQQYRYAG